MDKMLTVRDCSYVVGSKMRGRATERCGKPAVVQAIKPDPIYGRELVLDRGCKLHMTERFASPDQIAAGVKLVAIEQRKSDAPQHDPKTGEDRHVFVVRVRKSTWRSLLALAKAQGKTASAVIHSLIERAANDHPAP